MNRQNSKYYNTACLMDEAFILLLEKKEYKHITVKEICELAGVNRSTFYLHYESIGDLLEEAIQYINRKFLTEIDPSNDNMRERLYTCDINELYLVTPRYLSPYLEFVKNNRKLFSAAINNGDLFRLDNTYKSLFRDIFNPILIRFDVPENERPYLLAFYVKGVFAIVAEWLKNNCKDDIDFIINMMVNCVKSGSNQN